MIIEKLIGKEQRVFTKPKGRHLPIPIGFCQDGSVKELDVLETCPYRVYITGRCGSGKSTLLQNIVANGALRYSPDELVFYLVDLKNEGTFDYFRQLPHVKELVTSFKEHHATDILERFVQEENKRIELFRVNYVPNIERYNEKAIQEGRKTLPYCFFIIDEFYRLIEYDRYNMFVRCLGKGGSHITGIIIVVAGQSYSMMSDKMLRFVGTKIALRSYKDESTILMGNDKATLLDSHGQAIVNTSEYDEEGKYNKIIQVAYIDAPKDLPVIAQKIEDKYNKRKNSIKWGNIRKIVYRYGDCSVAPLYHRSYTITIRNNVKTIDVDSYGSIVLSRNYPNDQESFDKFKESLSKTGIHLHNPNVDDRTGITQLYLRLYDEEQCVFMGYTTNAEGDYGNMYLPKESVRLFHNEIPESVGDIINKTIEEAVDRQKEAEERRRREEEEKEKANLLMRFSKYRTLFESLFKDMVYIEGGSFNMGNDDEEAYEDEKPIHKVTLSPFYICRYEVTQELWTAVMDNNPSNFKGDKHPVEQVSYEDCQKFINKLNKLTGRNYRLPTEAEWEYAARGGDKSKGYKYAGSNNIDDVAWYTKTTNDNRTHKVGWKSPNELGLYDMSGNVWEWCQDMYGSYDSCEQIDPRGDVNGGNYVYRGGGFDSDARNCRVSRRNRFRPTFRYIYLGLRLAL